MEIEIDDFLEMVDEVLSLMSIFKNALENSAVEESYKV